MGQQGPSSESCGHFEMVLSPSIKSMSIVAHFLSATPFVILSPNNDYAFDFFLRSNFNDFASFLEFEYDPSCYVFSLSPFTITTELVMIRYRLVLTQIHKRRMNTTSSRIVPLTRNITLKIAVGRDVGMSGSPLPWESILEDMRCAIRVTTFNS